MNNLSVSEDADFLQMKWQEFCNWCIGRVVISIGTGHFHDEMYNILRFAGDWRIYNTK